MKPKPEAQTRYRSLLYSGSECITDLEPQVEVKSGVRELLVFNGRVV